MQTFRVLPIPFDLTNQARSTLKSPQYGHPAHAEVATGYGPCRSCLRTFDQGKEERLLFTYNPFEGRASLPAPGPIFIHRETCVAYDQPGFPPQLRRVPMVLEGYRDSWCVRREGVSEQKIELVIDNLFADPAIDFIHVRNAEAGCFIARIERA